MLRAEMIYTQRLEAKQTDITPLYGAARETSPLLLLSEWLAETKTHPNSKFSCFAARTPQTSPRSFQF